MSLRDTPVFCDHRSSSETRLLIAVLCFFVIIRSAAVRVICATMEENVGDVAGLQEKSGKVTFLMSIMCQFSTENIRPFL